ncbi:hypothetical protein PR001_g8673 [Phytophthora rubi]|nr:hypothetical protein PR002_g12284 [Phytophthora rubi]KAE9036772.1 hypothetical protein PR001_g8673 [Phytophthora rubi]
MALAKNVGYQDRTKHIDIRYHFIREKVVGYEMELEYVDTKNQLADFMTKGLSSKTLRYLMMRGKLAPGSRHRIEWGVAVALRCLLHWVLTARHTACAWLARVARACS